MTTLHSTSLYLLLIILLLLVLFAACAILILVRARRAAKKEPREEAAKQEEESRQAEQKLPSTFVGALSVLREKVTGTEYRYQVPWYVMLGAQGSGKTTLLTQSGLNALLEEDGESLPGETSVGWKFYGSGMVLDTGGEWTLPANGKPSPYWKRLMRLLNQYRPERPLEGIIVAMSAADLFGSTALDRNALSRRAIAIQQRLQEAQNILGFRFPVYFLLTKCDQIPGFVSFARELEAERQSEMFGWSNPYSLDALFEDSWVEEAFVNIRQTVEELQDQIYMHSGYSEDRQSMFILPDYLRVMPRLLTPFLSKIFQRSGMDGLYVLRGIYLAGEYEVQKATATTALPLHREKALVTNHHPELSILPSLLENLRHEGSSQISFVYDLFVKKIFPECNLAQPVRRFFYARNRAGVVLQVSTVCIFFLLLIGTVISLNRLRQNALALSPILSQIEADLRPAADGTTRYDGTEDFLIRLAGFQASGFRFLFLPSSWSGPLDRQIRAALVPTFRILVLEHFYDGLAEKARQITALNTIPLGAVPTNSNSIYIGISDVTVTPEYIQLKTFVEQLQRLEKNVALYQQLSVRGGVASAPTVFSIERYLYNQSDALGISDAENPYFEEALAKANFKPFVVSQADRDNASLKMTNLTSALFAAWIGNNPVRRSLDNLSSQLDKADTSSSVNYEDLQQLRQSFRLVQGNFDSPSLQWVARDNFEMPAQLYSLTITPLQRSMYLNSDLANWVNYDAEHRFGELQDVIAGERAGVTGALVEVSEEGKFVFSDSADNVRLSLENLMSLPFLPGSSSREVVSVSPSGTRIAWNNALLQNAAQQPQAYQDFIDSDLHDSSPRARSFFQKIAKARLRQALETEIAQAEMLSPRSPGADFQQDIQPQIQNFAASVDTLTSLLTVLRDQGLNDLYSKLSSLTNAQAGALLAELDRAFVADNVYDIPSAAMDQWVGSTGVTEAILNAHSPEDVMAYLAEQRDQIRAYSQASAPLLRFFAQQGARSYPGTTTALVNKWKGIAVALSQYDKKSPANSVTALESFVSTDLDKIVPVQMCPILPVRASTTPGDYFVRAQANMRRDIYGRCRAIANFNLIRDYRDLQTAFNNQLAGHFPFASVTSIPNAMDADPHAIAAFYQKFDAKSSLIERAIRQTDSGSGAYGDVLMFLKQMERARGFFSAADTDLPSLDFQPNFRVNQSREVDGDQILTWTLTVGSDVFRSGEPPRVGHWTYGQPVTLALRWAKDAPSLPLKGSPSGDAIVDGPSILFQFKDSWAFLNFLVHHAAPASQISFAKDTSPFVLRFQAYETAPGPHSAAAGISGPMVATVFMQINVFPSGGKQPMQEAIFPTEAGDLPVWAGNAVKAGGQ